VVKNAAGFDLPKFFVGSAGRFGAFAEITFKVFPRPAVRRTLRFEGLDAAGATALFAAAGRARWELYALDYLPAERSVYAQLGGPAAALDALAARCSHAGRVRTSTPIPPIVSGAIPPSAPGRIPAARS
jgi:glycolate oxidase FAD binding subunit